VADPVVAGVFEVKSDVLGGKDVAERFNRVGDKLKKKLRKELREIGEEVRHVAWFGAPVKKGNLRESIRASVGKNRGQRFIEAPDGLALKVAPYSPVAHLIERGVEPQVIDVHRKIYARKVWFRTGIAKDGMSFKRFAHERKLRQRSADTFMYQRLHHVDADPFFMPAVERAGDISVRLQRVITDLLGEEK
jgi:hypothetical protein